MTKPVFPFNAVVGQEQAKLALTLAAINPKIGGVLISGPRGTAKSTLARGLAQVLPASEARERPFVNMPLGTAEDRLIGSLDLEKVLGEGQVDFKPGLLKQAHEGVLYVDEVNLLPDHLVDHLLDVSASGVNRVERDGVSYEHPAQFLLVGTMNPDEGELRPQLLDRFGLAVEISDQFSVEERIQAVKIRELFEDHPETFLEQFAAINEQYAAQMAQASSRLGQIELSDALRLHIAERCVEAGVDGLRADIVWTRAAIAHTAWRCGDQVELEDVRAVESLVLNSRGGDASAGGGPANHTGSGSGSNSRSNSPSKSDAGSQSGQNTASSPFKRPPESHRQSRTNTQSQTSSQNGSEHAPELSGHSDSQSPPEMQTSALSDWGQISPQAAPDMNVPDTTVFDAVQQALHSAQPTGARLTARHDDLAVRSSRRRFKFSPTKRLSATLAGRHETQGGAIDWFHSLLMSRGRWPLPEIRFQKRRPARQVIHQVMVDTSGSGLTGNGQSGSLAAALGFIKTLSQDAYLKREGFSLIGFGNNEVRLIGDYVRSPKRIEALLRDLTTGGGTPLQEAIAHLKASADRLVNKHPHVTLVNYVISDGRARASLVGQSLPGTTVWIDTEQSTVKRGFGRRFAEELGATYLSAFVLGSRTAQGYSPAQGC